ncbi:MAG: putative baseplate assembly protein [Exilibacterium sp.]
MNTLFTQFVANLTELLDQAGNNAIGVTAPAKFVDSLLLEPLAQAKGSLSLSRSLQQAVASGTDLHPQLLVNFAPRIKGTFYRAWSGARVNAAESPLRAVYAMRVNAPLFGAGAAKIPTYAGTGVSISGTSSVSPGQLLPPSQWDEWPLDNDELTATDSLFLDQLYEKVQPESYVLIQQPAFQGMERQVLQITNLQNLQRTAYGISGKTTRLTLEANWRSENDATLAALRRALIYAQSEQLELADKPIDDDVYGQSIELSGLFENLKSGRWIILSGERADIEQVSGVPVSELLLVSSLEHGYDAALAGDSMHTSLNLATPTAYRYKRDTLKIYANVVKATHGETREEVLGSGDGAQSMQTFELKQPPLTFVAATTPQGVESTLNVYINNVNWPEADSLADLGARERGYITQTDNDDKVSIRFGDGVNGERLPTGVENVRAVYRNGIGANGNVEAEQISLLMSRPSGVKEVINPLRASGGAGRESRDLARENAPLAVKALDRLLSVQDYADFSRTFAGIGKATARKLSNGRQQLVHVTIAGVDDIPIDPVSDLYSNLVAALKRFGDPDLMVNVQLRELLILMLSAKVQLQENYLWEPVVSDIKSALLQTFGFQQRALGQAVGLDEVISVIQAVRGVAYVDVDAFGGLPEKKLDQGTRRLLTLDELAERAQQIADPGRFRDDIEKPTMGGDKGMQKNSGKLIVDPANLVRANLADFEGGVLRPAQLAIFSAAVQDTLILNQIT